VSSNKNKTFLVSGSFVVKANNKERCRTSGPSCPCDWHYGSGWRLWGLSHPSSWSGQLPKPE